MQLALVYRGDEAKGVYCTSGLTTAESLLLWLSQASVFGAVCSQDSNYYATVGDSNVVVSSLFHAINKSECVVNFVRDNNVSNVCLTGSYLGRPVRLEADLHSCNIVITLKDDYQKSAVESVSKLAEYLHIDN